MKNRIILALGCLSWLRLRSFLLRERSLLRGQLLSLLYLTWLSLPFSVVFRSWQFLPLIHALPVPGYIRFLPVCRNGNDVKRIFLRTGEGKCAGKFEDMEPDPDKKGGAESIASFAFFVIDSFPRDFFCQQGCVLCLTAIWPGDI